ncbi:MAG TPA: tRNA (adenosine(37)-N6)-threonylcarbamoyltransferase complex ATPase subunit type 1 TsaE [Acidimicrobiales bacterium]|nr:tRNA (adenosine(37)-N6)-threonylcarbamoyltransferase complex ATPase subunit type 1 TsaE [Acidimicrobiales bacterium]
MTASAIVARTSSADETRALAAALSTVLRPGDLVLLVGDLGTGKTTFSQGLAAGLGVTESVTSPTFTLVRAYRCHSSGDRGAIRTLLHADLYRLDRLQDVVELGLGEMVEDDAVAVIEWGDVAGSLFGHEALTVRLSAAATPAERADDERADEERADEERADEERADEERTVTVEPDGSWWARSDALAERLRRWKA